MVKLSETVRKENRKRAIAKYNASPKRKISARRYWLSEKGKLCGKIYRQSKKGKLFWKKYRETKHGRERIRAAQYRFQQSDKARIVHKKYDKTPKGKEAAIRTANLRRARIRIVCDLTASQWNEIKKTYQYACVYCGCKDRPLTRDHVIPISRGGHHTKENIVPACQPCNTRKGAKLITLQDSRVLSNYLRIACKL